MSEIQRINMDVPKALWRRVKIRAAEEGRMMREIVVEALERYLEGAKVMTAHQEMEVRRLAQERLLDRRDAIECGEEVDYTLTDEDIAMYFEFEQELDSPEARRIFRDEWERGVREMEQA